MADQDRRPATSDDAATDAVILSEPEQRDPPMPPVPEEADILRDLPPDPPSDPHPPTEPDPVVDARPEPEAPAAIPPQKSAGWVGVVLGGAIAAGLGFGLATLVPQGWPIGAGDTAALEAAIADQTTEIAAVKAQLETLAAQPQGLAPDALDPVSGQAAAALAAAEAAGSALSGLEPRVAALEQRMTDLESRPVGDGTAPVVDLSAVDAELVALREELEAQKGAGAMLVADVQAAAAAAEIRLVETKAQAQALKDAADAAARAATTAAAVARVQAAFDSGASFADPLADLVEAGLEVPAVLANSASGGLPTLAGLEAAFPAAAREALEASLRANMGESVLDRAAAFLRSQTGARSLTPREGSDPDAVLSRAEAALRAGALADTLAEIAALPAEGQAALAGWTALAQRRLDATEAVSALAAAADAL